ncbi:spore germination protein [Metabacillus sp. FJAT-53654]|uniref:Spore germination protein n=1 Tax=Metabacillus rhizosphaerae TaxID=3117747 RepID=A0ABZ2MRK0_9BACI
MSNLFKDQTKKSDQYTEVTNLQLLSIDKLKELYSYPLNSDLKIRELYLSKSKKRLFIFYLNPIVNTEKLRESIIHPLLNSGEESHLSTIIDAEEVKSIDSVASGVNAINNGAALILEEGTQIGYIVDIAKFESRNIEKSQNENIIKGPKEGFTESLNMNLSLIRKIIRSEHLITETIPINRLETESATLLYLKNVANEKIIENVRNRISHIEVDFVHNIEKLEQLIEERPYSLFPSILYTERPDRVVSYLEEGHIVILTGASSASLVAPATFWSFFHTGEDHYLRFLYGNFSRLVRLLGLFITLFMSALYVGITNFHHEMLPPDLLLAIASTREKVPFPVVVEVLIMEFSFELIREAGLRIPSPLGPTIGIVGALILGQAAVQANIISPIIVIVVAFSGLASFTISDISMNYSLRLLRFMFISIAGMMGIYGLGAIFVSFICYLTSLTSFGVPFLAPLTPTYKSAQDTIFRKVIAHEVFRPGFTFPKLKRRKS